MIAYYEDVPESEASEIFVEKFKNPRSIRSKKTTNVRGQTELQDFLVVGYHHRQRRETSSKKMMLESIWQEKGKQNRRFVVPTRGEFIYRHHEEPRLKLYDPDNETYSLTH